MLIHEAVFIEHIHLQQTLQIMYKICGKNATSPWYAPSQGLFTDQNTKEYEKSTSKLCPGRDSNRMPLNSSNLGPIATVIGGADVHRTIICGMERHIKQLQNLRNIKLRFNYWMEYKLIQMGYGISRCNIAL